MTGFFVVEFTNEQPDRLYYLYCLFVQTCIEKASILSELSNLFAWLHNSTYL